MKKVLIISASPRKGGNSDTLCDQFAKGVAAANMSSGFFVVYLWFLW